MGDLMHPNTLMNVCELLSTIDSEIQLQTLKTFLYVAARGSCSQKDLEMTLKLTNASASRNISYWTDRRFDRKPGKGYIERIDDEFDKRFKTLRLTRKGRDFVTKLKEI